MRKTIEYQQLSSIEVQESAPPFDNYTLKECKNEQILQVNTYTINPFDRYYPNISDTLSKVCRLLQLVSKSLAIKWTEQHQRLLSFFTEKVMLECIPTPITPTMKELYATVEDGFREVEKEDLVAFLDIKIMLELFVSEELDSPFKRLFSGHTNLPAITFQKELILEWTDEEEELLPLYVSFLQEHYISDIREKTSFIE